MTSKHHLHNKQLDVPQPFFDNWNGLDQKINSFALFQAAQKKETVGDPFQIQREETVCIDTNRYGFTG